MIKEYGLMHIWQKCEFLSEKWELSALGHFVALGMQIYAITHAPLLNNNAPANAGNSRLFILDLK